MRKIFIICSLLVSCLAIGCAADNSRTVFTYDREPIPSKLDGTQYTFKNVEYAILKALRKKGWSASPVEPGLIEATITIRSRHRAKIAIPFTTTHYSIEYVDSSGLEYRKGKIHKNYNHWVSRLDAEIKKEFGLRTQRF